jgi:transposase InsO family protein
MTDNGGEFSNEKFKEVASIMGVNILTTAAESPFQNGMCERNHAIVDNMLEKLAFENPRTPLDTLMLGEHGQKLLTESQWILKFSNSFW